MRMQDICSPGHLLSPLENQHSGHRSAVYRTSYDLSEVCLKFIVKSTYDSDLRCANISLRDIVSQFTNTISDDVMILQANRTQKKPCVLREIFCKSDVCRKSTVTLQLSLDNRKRFCKPRPRNARQFFAQTWPSTALQCKPCTKPFTPCTQQLPSVD